MYQLLFSSSVLRWSPDVRDSIEKDGGLACNVLVVAIDPVATGKMTFTLR